MNDKAYQFVSKLFATYNYNGSQWEVDAQMDSYYNCLLTTEAETGKEYDYDRLYSLIEREYKYKTVPGKKEIISWQKRCVKHNYNTSDNGALMVVKCYRAGTDGHYELKEIRNYIVHNSEYKGKDVQQISKELRRRYDEVAFKQYPAGSVLVGNTVFYPEDENGECKKEKIA